jgi:hypothetical protein
MESKIKAGMIGIYLEIAEERVKQDEQWGGPEHDDEHTAFEWLGIITHYLGRGLINADVLSRKAMVQVAALAVAAIEWIDRRHTVIADVEAES